MSDTEIREYGARLDGIRILHVLATGQRRGAEVFANDLMRELVVAGAEQRVGILHDRPVALDFPAPVTMLHANAARLPGLRVGLGAVRRLRAQIEAFAPNILHAHGGEAYKHVVLASRRRGIPILYRRITESQASAKRGLARRAHGSLMRRSDQIVAVADALRAETIEIFGVPGERVLTIPRGIDARRLEPGVDRPTTRSRLGLAPDARVVLSLLALVWEKDPMAHLQIMGSVLERDPKAVYLLAGEGPMRAEIERWVESHGLAERIRVLGSRSDVADLLAASDLLLLASILEGMPGCLIEAGMAGVPVVAFAVAGVPEIVVDGRTGEVVPARNLPEMVDRVSALLADEGSRRRMGEQARRHCRRYDIGVIAGRYRDIYARLAAAPEEAS
jgi:glycosyltransferase involved in cell wall biosynthesis